MNPSMLHSKHAAFHVLVTSYQTVVSDKAVFSKIKWEYMILDEAQAIKSANRSVPFSPSSSLSSLPSYYSSPPVLPSPYSYHLP
jgi:hypothetical protein